MSNLMVSSAVKSFLVNNHGRDFVIGDIHGCFNVFDSLLKKVKFDVSRDRVFSVGDLIDRGPDSAQVTYWLNQPWFHSVRGNHEQMAIECLSGSGDIPRHTRNGGAWLYELSRSAQLKIIEALSRLPVLIEVELPGRRKIGIVHAEVPLFNNSHGWYEAKVSTACEENQRDALRLALYSRKKIDRQDNTPVAGIETIYVGHTTVAHITRLGNVVYIDTGCSFSDGALSLVELRSGAVASESMTSR